MEEFFKLAGGVIQILTFLAAIYLAVDKIRTERIRESFGHEQNTKELETLKKDLRDLSQAVNELREALSELRGQIRGQSSSHDS